MACSRAGKKYTPKITINLREDTPERIPQIVTSFWLSRDSEISFEKQILPALESELQQLDKSFTDTFNLHSSFQILEAASIFNYTGKFKHAIRAYKVTRSGSPCYLFPELFKQSPWFERWFNQCNPRNYYAQGICTIVHNGIYAGNFTHLFPDRSVIARAILILKDDYRPTLGLSRNRIQDLPLEAICSLNALADCIQYSLELPKLHFHYYDAQRPTKDYWGILGTSSFSLSNLHFMTNIGVLTLSEIKLVLKTHEKLELEESVRDALRSAVILQQLDLRIAFSQEHGITVYIVEKIDSVISERLSALPPGLFILPLTDNVTSMGIYEHSGFSSEPYSRPPYNAMHPFPKWLIRNGTDLQNSVPGIYHQFIRQLLSGENLIQNINTLLSRLHQIPRLGIEIPQNLTKDDFFVITDIETE